MSRIMTTVLVGVFAATAQAVPLAQTTDLYLLEFGRGAILRITPEGSVSQAVSRASIDALLPGAGVDFENRGVTFDKLGNMYFTEGLSRSVVKRTPQGVMSVLTDAATIQSATGAGDANPRGVDIGADGFLYVTDSASDSVLKVNTTTGVASVLVNEAALQAAGVAAVAGFETVSVKTGIAATSDGKVYVVSDGFPDTIFAIQSDGGVSVVASGLPPFDNDPLLFDLDLFLSVDPITGDLVVGNDGSGGGGDDGHNPLPPEEPDAYLTLRLTDNDLSALLSQTFLDALVGSEADLEGGTAFDAAGNFYFGDRTTNSIYRVDRNLEATLFASAAAIELVTGRAANFEGGMAFAPPPVPEPTTLLLGALVLGTLGWSIRRSAQRLQFV